MPTSNRAVEKRARTYHTYGRVQRNQNGSSEVAEFVPTLYILFLLILVPLLDLGNLFIAAATQYLATNDFAAKAATQADYPSALNSMANEAFQFQSSGFAKFAHMQPEGGYTGCGDDLYLLQTDIGSGVVKSSGADTPLTPPIDTKASTYEISVKSVYSVEPLLSLAALPLLGGVPGLGQPVTFTFTANRPVEHPGGLQGAAGNSVSSGGSVTPFARIASSPGTTGPVTTVTWRNPGIYQQIKAAGQTIVSSNVFIVQANNPNWTPAGVTVPAGAKIWVDTQAIGQWSPGVAEPYTDANGKPGTAGGPTTPSPAGPWGSLNGKVGTGTPFFVGDDQYNYPLAATGTLSMIMNDAIGVFGDNTGAQMVRVIVVQ
jgi:hypothetical protein